MRLFYISIYWSEVDTEIQRNNLLILLQSIQILETFIDVIHRTPARRSICTVEMFLAICRTLFQRWLYDPGDLLDYHRTLFCYTMFFLNVVIKKDFSPLKSFTYRYPPKMVYTVPFLALFYMPSFDSTPHPFF